MFTTSKRTKANLFWKRLCRPAVGFVGVAALSGSLLLSPAAFAQNDDWDTDYEYQPDEGYHEEEWYDPSDWFDDDTTTSYEDRAWYNQTYDYGYDYDLYDDNDWWNDDDDWYDDYDYVYDYDDMQYGYHYQWNPVSDRWELDYGYHYEYYTPAYYTDLEDNEDQLDRYRDDYPDTERGDRERDRDRTMRDRQQQRERDMKKKKSQRKNVDFTRTRTATGTIKGFRHVTLQGQPDSHTLVRIKMNDGSMQIIDLGPKKDLKDFDLEEGDTIRIKGREGMINDRKVFMADRVTMNGDTTDINRARFAARTFDHPTKTDRGEYAVSGTIDDYKKVDIDAAKDKHTLVRLKLKDGKELIANLGPNMKLSNLNLDKGDKVTLVGKRKKINKKPVLMTSMIRVDSGNTAIVRGDDWRMNN